MAKRQIRLSETEITAFGQAEQATRDVHELKRLQAVRLYGMGEAVQTIQKLVGRGPVSPCQWAMEYQRGGMAALRSKWQGGNGNKLSGAQRADLVKKLEQDSPEQLIAPDKRPERGPFWTLSDLSMVLEQWYGVRYRSQTSLRGLLTARIREVELLVNGQKATLNKETERISRGNGR